jgi:hypothetical protein
MGTIREASTGRMHRLEAEHLFGRMGPPRCSQTLAEPHASSVHAVLRWNGRDWELKDLNSTNGTFVDGELMPEASALLLSAGSRIGFGDCDNEWELVDTGCPEAMAIPLDGGDPVRMIGEILALPSSDEPRATIYRALDEGWILEQPDEAPVTLHNKRTFEAANRSWRFCCFESAPPTRSYRRSSGPTRLVVEKLRLSFAVSRDEEHVALRATCGERRLELGERAHNYLLLTLARRRLKDMGDGFPDSSCGWVDVEDLARDPTMAPPGLNIDVHRIREHFGRLGVLDAARIIERRHRPRQLRIGARDISVATL